MQKSLHSLLLTGMCNFNFYSSSKNSKAELKPLFNLYFHVILLNLDTALNKLKHTPRYLRTQLQIKLVLHSFKRVREITPRKLK